MTKYLIYITLSLHCIWCIGQGDPIYTQLHINPYLVNPAVAGSNQQIELRLIYRQQWGNFPGVPRTFSGSVHGNINSKNALGIMFTNDQVGVSERTDIQVSYAFHIPMNIDETTFLSLGAGLKYLQFNIETQRLYLQNRNDPTFANAAENQTAMDLVFGAFLYGEEFYAGIATPNLIRTGINVAGNDEILTRLYRHMYAMGAYRFRFEEVGIEPSILIRYAERQPLQIEGNIRTYMVEDRVMLGIGYRSGWLLSLMIGIKTPNNIHIFYAADFPTAKNGDPVRTFGVSSELAIGIDLSNLGG